MIFEGIIVISCLCWENILSGENKNSFRGKYALLVFDGLKDSILKLMAGGRQVINTGSIHPELRNYAGVCNGDYDKEFVGLIMIKRQGSPIKFLLK